MLSPMTSELSNISSSSTKEKRRVRDKRELEEELIRTIKKYKKHNVNIMSNAVKLFKLVQYDPSIELPIPLPWSVPFKEKQLFNDLVEVKQVNIYEAISTFRSTDSRYLCIDRGDWVTGLYSTQGWVFAVKDQHSKQIGFVPESYLEYEKTVK